MAGRTSDHHVGPTPVRASGTSRTTRRRESQAEQLDLGERDADVELSDLGRTQAECGGCGAWMARAPDEWRPTVVLSSPFRRAAETASVAGRAAGVEVVLDERLRERDLGTLDGLTGRGIRARLPEEASQQEEEGSESSTISRPAGRARRTSCCGSEVCWADLRHGYDDEKRIWLFTHQAVIMSFRYALEGLTEESLLEGWTARSRSRTRR